MTVRSLVLLLALAACSADDESIARPAPEDDAPAPARVVPLPVSPPKTEDELAYERAAAVRDRMRLLALSLDGKRALLGVVQPIARAPELRVVDVATNRIEARVELMAMAALPRRPSAHDSDFDRRLDNALRDNRLLAEELAWLAPMLAEFPLRAGGDFAAADARHVAYVADELRVMRDGDPLAEHLRRAEDPWIAGDRFLYKIDERWSGGLYAMPIAGGPATKIAGAEHPYLHATPVVLPDGTLRAVTRTDRQTCAVDLAVTKANVARTTCLAPPCNGCFASKAALSPSGGWLAASFLGDGAVHIRAVDLATGRQRTDKPFDIAGELAVDDRGRVYTWIDDVAYDLPRGRRLAHDPEMRDCRFRGEQLVCVRGERIALIDLPR